LQENMIAALLSLPIRVLGGRHPSENAEVVAVVRETVERLVAEVS
jgi:hypothetical protein